MAKKFTTEEYINRLIKNRKDKASYYDYSKVVYTKLDDKIIIGCPLHGEFKQIAKDHATGSGCRECGKILRKKTCLEKYGVDNPFKDVTKIQKSMINKYGVKNPGLLPNHVEKCRTTNRKKYGYEVPLHSPELKEKRKIPSINKYGVEYPMQNKKISAKGIKTKIETGGFSSSNSSSEATKYIKEYIKSKNYSIDQCAFADAESGIHEWGIYFEGRWTLFDLVVFENGHRGDKSKILEILEYHGPFHYTTEDAKIRGDSKAYPWKTNTTTITESVKRDLQKEKLGKQLTANYTIVWYNR